MPARPRPAHAISPWLLALLFVVIDLGLATALFAFDLRIDVGLPAATVLATPLVVYALVVFLAQPRFRAGRYLAAVAVAVALHALLTLLASGLDVALDGRTWTPGVALALATVAPLVVLQIVFAPLALAPFRDRLAPPPPATPRRRPAPEPRATPRAAASRPAGAVSSTPPAAMPAPSVPAAAPVAAAPPPATPDAADPRMPPVVDASLSPAPAMPVVDEPAGPAVSPPSGRADAGADADDTAARPTEPCVKIRFERLVSQLAADVFTLPPDRVGATLAEADHVLVPLRLVLPQLADGVVRIGWDAVAGQFPRRTLAIDRAALGVRLAEGLVLPLDEIVPQLPAETFALARLGVDTGHLEEFPLPFRPDATPEPPVVEPVVQPVAEPEPARAMPEIVVEEATAPRAIGRAIPAPLAEHLAEARGIAAAFNAVGGVLEVDVEIAAGVPLFLVISPRRERSAVLRAATRVVAVLAERRGSAPVTQISLRGARGAVVVTPLGPASEGDPVLVTALAPGASLALVEMLAARAAGDAGRGGRRPEAEPMPADAEFRPVSVGPALVDVAATLGAFGPVAPAVLEDDGGGLALYLFTAPSRPVAPIARLARALYTAAADGEAAGALASIAVRLGGEHLLVMPLTGPSGHPALLVAGGVVDRPGLARLQITRAAAVLGAAAS